MATKLCISGYVYAQHSSPEDSSTKSRFINRDREYLLGTGTQCRPVTVQIIQQESLYVHNFLSASFNADSRS